MDEMQLTVNEEIALVIDSKYSIDAQIAILRQKDEKPDEWAEFNAFCEEVKRKVKESRKEE
jgi:hypothetical protein